MRAVTTHHRRAQPAARTRGASRGSRHDSHAAADPTAAGGAAFLGSLVVAVVRPWGGDAGVVWAFVVLYGVAFALTRVLKVPQVRGEAH